MEVDESYEEEYYEPLPGAYYITMLPFRDLPAGHELKVLKVVPTGPDDNQVIITIETEDPEEEMNGLIVYRYRLSYLTFFEYFSPIVSEDV